MANYNNLKDAIKQVIKQNGNQEITGNVLQNSLLSMINSLGNGYQFMGVATPSTNPGTPDQKVFYIASEAGTYANFGSIVLASGEIVAITYNGNWVKNVVCTINDVSAKVSSMDGDMFCENIFSIANSSRSKTTGEIETYAYGRTTELIDVDDIIGARTNGIKIKSGTFRGSSLGVAFFYDANKAFLSYDDSTITYSPVTPYPAASIPSNAKYIAFFQYDDTESVILDGKTLSQYKEQVDSNTTNIASLDSRTANLDKYDGVIPLGVLLNQPKDGIFTISGYYYDTSGAKTAFANACTTELLLIDAIEGARTNGIALKSGRFRMYASSAYAVAVFYDKDMAFLSAVQASAVYSRYTPFPASLIPSDAEYMRFSCLGGDEGVFPVILQGYDCVSILKRIAENEASAATNASGLSSLNDKLFGVVASQTKTFPISGYTNYVFENVKAGEYLIVPSVDKNILCIIRTNIDGTVTDILTNVYIGKPLYIKLDSDVLYLYIYVGGASAYSGDVTMTLYKNAIISPIQEEESTVTEIVNYMMSKTDFITALNSAMATYSANSLYGDESYAFFSQYASFEQIYAGINKSFRYKVIDGTEVTFKDVCSKINVAFTTSFLRFEDAKCVNTRRNASINTGFQADEPSAVISENGSTLHIYAHLKRISTTDGVHWTAPIDTPLSGEVTYLMHNNVCVIDGVYYLIGTNINTGGSLYMFTSTDGINFMQKGKLFDSGVELQSGHPVASWGNVAMIKDNGTFYLYIESQSSGQSWVIHLVTYTNFDTVNSDGTIGDATIYSANPILIRPYESTGYVEGTAASSAGNPDFAKLMDNRPIKTNGKYYMYFHSTWKAIAHILRASSSDLKTWSVDGTLADNRDVPTGGDKTSGNADHCIIEFKGRTYLFYSWDINNPDAVPYIKYTIDDRPMREVCKMMP